MRKVVRWEELNVSWNVEPSEPCGRSSLVTATMSQSNQSNQLSFPESPSFLYKALTMGTPGGLAVCGLACNVVLSQALAWVGEKYTQDIEWH